MARSMITGKETQKMQEYTQERIAQAERRDIEFSTDVKEQIFEYANLIGEEEKVRNLVKSKKEPITAEERKLAIIWQRVLEGENVSVYDNFFSCGGNSLKAIQLVNEINKDFQKQIAINELFENSTIEKLAKLLTTSTDELESDEQEEGFL